MTTAVVAVLAWAVGLGPWAWQSQSLTGTVKSAAGTPVPGAVVLLEQGSRTIKVVTDAAGAFTVADVTFPVVVEVSSPGVGTARRVVTASPVELTLSPTMFRESIVVSAMSLPGSDRPAQDATTAGLQLPREFLETVPSVTPDEAIRVVSGFSLFRRSTSRASNPTTHGVTMRGLSASGASRGLVLLDGVPLNEGFGSWVTWTRVPSAVIGEVAMQRGAQGDIFGSDALGGVIEITPPTRPSFATLRFQAASEGTGETEIALSGRFGRVTAFGSTSWFTTDGVIPVAPESRGPVDQRADAEWFNGYGRLTATFGSRRLVIAGWGGEDDRGNGTVVQRNRMSGGTFATSFDVSSASSHMAARVSYSPNTLYQTFSTINGTRTQEVLNSTQYMDADTTRVAVEVGHNVHPTTHLVGRVAVGRGSANFRDDRPNPANSVNRALRDDSEAISLQAGFAPAAAVTLAGGIRQEWRRAPEAGAERDSATVGRFTGAWKASGLLTIRGSFASSHRWPTLNELVRPFQAGAIVTLANPDLLPERARSADVGGTLAFNRWTMTTTGFWSVVEGAIANVTTATNTRQRRNAGEAHAKGVEIDGDVRAWSSLWLRASATIVDARFRESQEPNLEGKRLPQVPKVSFTWSAVAKLPRGLEASAVWRALSDQYDDDRNTFLLAEARQLDFQVAGRMRGFRWHLALENALDRRIEVGRTPLVTLAPGRAVRVGLAWRR
jgi:outer membrane receptor protein involved in Fe transport